MKNFCFFCFKFQPLPPSRPTLTSVQTVYASKDFFRNSFFRFHGRHAKSLNEVKFLCPTILHTDTTTTQIGSGTEVYVNNLDYELVDDKYLTIDQPSDKFIKSNSPTFKFSTSPLLFLIVIISYTIYIQI